MEPAAILDQLTDEEGLPRTALLAASAQRTEMVPLFLEEIEKYLVASASERGEPTPLFFIFHLLGEWRETSAYRPLARLLRCPEEQLEAALGWSTTETAHRIMAAVCDGDPQPIYDIILDAEADEYVRSRMCEALAMLVLQGTLERDRVVHFLRDCWLNLQPRDVCFVWNGWQSAIAMLGLVELKDIAKEVFDRQSSIRVGSSTSISSAISSLRWKTPAGPGRAIGTNTPHSAMPSRNSPAGTVSRKNTSKTGKKRAERPPNLQWSRRRPS